jgi:transposase
MTFDGKNIFLACGATDLRKQINGLMLTVQSSFKLDPFSEAVYVFCNRSRDCLKILEWDGDGFWLHIKRLECGRFKWPSSDAEKTMALSCEELACMLSAPGLEQKLRHNPVIGRVIG